jgi:hypothetical protein
MIFVLIQISAAQQVKPVIVCAARSELICVHHGARPSFRSIQSLSP